MLSLPKHLGKYVFGLGAYDENSDDILSSDHSKRAMADRGVYVLQVNDGDEFYVGKSKNIKTRIAQHESGQGSNFITKIVKRVSPQTAPSADWESWERSETLYLMHKHGVDKIRGWMYTKCFLSDDERRHASLQICEKYDLCRRCGVKGHFIEECQKLSSSMLLGSNATLCFSSSSERSL